MLEQLQSNTSLQSDRFRRFTRETCGRINWPSGSQHEKKQNDSRRRNVTNTSSAILLKKKERNKRRYKDSESNYRQKVYWPGKYTTEGQLQQRSLHYTSCINKHCFARATLWGKCEGKGVLVRSMKACKDVGVLNICTTRRCIASITPRPLYPREWT